MSQPNLTTIITKLRQQLPLLTEHYDVKSLGVYGSYRRHEQHPDNDLGLLVRFHEPPGLVKYIELESYLSDFLDVQVDLVMNDAVQPAGGGHSRHEFVH
jgi:predicted nucleotidyltransferase